MFKRRRPRDWPRRLTDAVWPAIGWRRTVRYYWHRVQRIPGSPESIAAGFACGAAASILPLMGLHFLLSALLALLVRGSVVASAFGTVVGNPWTFPAIWLGTYRLGAWLLDLDGAAPASAQPLREALGGLIDAMLNVDGAAFMDRVWPVWWPMMVGALPLALLTGLATYWLLVRAMRQVGRMRSARAAARFTAEA
jgi:uncharacterized protein (DUF2062 family)